MNSRLNSLLFCCLFSALQGCASSNHQTPSLDILVDSNHCPFNNAFQQVFTNRENLLKQLQSTGNNLAGAALITGTEPTSPPVDSFFKALSSTLEHVDFSSQSVIVIARGHQSSPAFTISVTGDNATWVNNELLLPIRLESPQPGKMYPQVMVTPCIAVAVHTNKKIEQFTLQQ